MVRVGVHRTSGRSKNADTRLASTTIPPCLLIFIQTGWSPRCRQPATHYRVINAPHHHQYGQVDVFHVPSSYMVPNSSPVDGMVGETLPPTPYSSYQKPEEAVKITLGLDVICHRWDMSLMGSLSTTWWCFSHSDCSVIVACYWKDKKMCCPQLSCICDFAQVSPPQPRLDQPTTSRHSGLLVPL